MYGKCALIRRHTVAAYPDQISETNTKVSTSRSHKNILSTRFCYCFFLCARARVAAAVCIQVGKFHFLGQSNDENGSGRYITTRQQQHIRRTHTHTTTLAIRSHMTGTRRQNRIYIFVVCQQQQLEWNMKTSCRYHPQATTRSLTMPLVPTVRRNTLKLPTMHQ